MRPSYFTFTALLFLYCFFSSYSCLSSSAATFAPAPSRAPSYSNTVEEACLMAWEDRYPSCVATLHSLPGSSNATLVDLAVLSLGLATSDLGDIVKRLQELQSHGSVGAATHEGLSKCSAVCTTAISGMEECERDFQEANYSGALLYLTDYMDDFVMDCQDVGDEQVAKKRDQLFLVHGVAKAIAYKYCWKFAKQEEDCVF